MMGAKQWAAGAVVVIVTSGLSCSDEVNSTPGSGGGATSVGGTSTTATDTASTTATTSTTSSTSTTSTTSSTSTSTGPALFDCYDLPAGPLSYVTLTGLYASEDFAFDDSGHLISHHGSALYKQEYPPGTVTAFAVTPGGAEGPASLRMLATGDVVYANVDTSTLYRVEPNGTTHVIYGALGYAMGIDIHDSGMVFLSDLMGLLRFEPYSTDMDVLIAAGVLNYANGMTFGKDYDALYFGTHDGVYSVAVDGAGTPLGSPQLWADKPGPGELLGMGVDRCGNVYVLHDGRRLLRYPAAGGSPDTLVELASAWMTNLQWGSGIGGWDEQSVYITDRANDVYYEIVVGVPAKIY